MNPFVKKLAHIAAQLTGDDHVTLAKLADPVRWVERGDILREGSEPRAVAMILEGWACRYKQLGDGKRQITAIFVPGDLCEPFGAVPRLMDHSIGALTPVLLGLAAPQAIRGIVSASPRIEEALWWDLLCTDAIGREHIVSLGRRSATERLGHFFCEMLSRLKIVGLTDQSSYDVPLTQADLADLFGLSAVHVNRSLQELRGSGLLSFRGRRATIHDVGGLSELSMFDPTYLGHGGSHQNPAPTRDDRNIP